MRQRCVATAADWLGPTLNNVHTAPDGDWSQVSCITHTGALLIGTYDRFTDGDPVAFLSLSLLAACPMAMPSVGSRVPRDR